MKKYQYIVAAACVLVGAVGFASMYATDQSQKRQEQQAKNQQLESQMAEEETQSSEFENLAQNQESQTPINDVAEVPLNPSLENDQLALNGEDEIPESNTEDDVNIAEENTSNEAEETPVDVIKEEVMHFQPEDGLVWPIEGSVLLDYSMDATVYFPTLQQYQYNPAMIIDGEVNSKVYFVAKGKITNIETNEVTGCTVTQDLGDGYTAIYGQLKELNFEVGDKVESGQVVGYVSEPTKYYSVEGPNVYFQLLKDGVPVDPEEILP